MATPEGVEPPGWYLAFKQQRGRTPNAPEIQQYEVAKARAGKDTSAADVQKAIQIAEYKQRQLEAIDRQREEERAKRDAEVDKNFKVIGSTTPTKNAAEKQKVDAQLETKYGPKSSADERRSRQDAWTHEGRCEASIVTDVQAQHSLYSAHSAESRGNHHGGGQTAQSCRLESDHEKTDSCG
jgi:hypothetical protein